MNYTKMPQYQNGGQQQQQEAMMQLIQIFAQQNNLDPKQVIQALQSGKLTIEQIEEALNKQEAPQEEMEQEGMEQEEMGQPQPQMMYGGVPKYGMGGSRYMYQNGGKIDPTDPSTYPTRRMEEPTFFNQEIKRQAMYPNKKPMQSPMQNPRNPKDFYDQSYINYISNLGKPSNQNQYNTIQRSSYKPATPMMQYVTLPRYGVGGTAIDFSAVPQSPVNLVGPRMEDNRFISNNGLQLAGNRAQMSTLGPNNSRMTVGNPEAEMNTEGYDTPAFKVRYASTSVVNNAIPTSGGSKEFELAFDANRRSGAKVFTFNNKLYNTNLATNNTKPIAVINKNGSITPLVKPTIKNKTNQTIVKNSKNVVPSVVPTLTFPTVNPIVVKPSNVSVKNTKTNNNNLKYGISAALLAGSGGFGGYKVYQDYQKNPESYYTVSELKAMAKKPLKPIKEFMARPNYTPAELKQIALNGYNRLGENIYSNSAKAMETVSKNFKNFIKRTK